MTYAFHTTDKLCFILDLMNGKNLSTDVRGEEIELCLGGDLHYHLSQHGVFSEKEVKFYAAEIILGLEHMHLRSIVYRDLKVSGEPSIDRRENEGDSSRRTSFWTSMDTSGSRIWV